MASLTDSEIKQSLKSVPQWKLDGKAIARTFEFGNFVESVEFVNEVTEIAEDFDHHPDVDIRWNKVTLHLSTHSKGGLTAKDFDVAQRVDEIA